MEFWSPRPEGNKGSLKSFVNTLFGHMSDDCLNFSVTSFAPSSSPCRPRCCNGEDFMIRLHSAVCWGRADFGRAVIALCTAPRVDSPYFHQLLTVRSRQWFRHQAGGIHMRNDFLGDELLRLGRLLYPQVPHVHVFRLAQSPAVDQAHCY